MSIILKIQAEYDKLSRNPMFDYFSMEIQNE